MDVCVLLIEGTNCEQETKKAFESVGLDAELVHLKQLIGKIPEEKKRRLSDYNVLMLPGGWSAGDYVRAGAIFAARMKSHLREELREFIESGRLVGGVCNGFQILVELGLLPAFEGITWKPRACLTNNIPARFQCRPTYIKHENECRFTSKIEENQVLQIPVAHAEGRFTFGENEREKEMLQRLIDNEQIVFTYCTSEGEKAEGKFPWNPNASVYDIAGICNPEGNVLGMMPHPERVIHGWQMTGPSRKKKEKADGLGVFESVAGYVRENL